MGVAVGAAAAPCCWDRSWDREEGEQGTRWGLLQPMAYSPVAGVTKFAPTLREVQHLLHVNVQADICPCTSALPSLHLLLPIMWPLLLQLYEVEGSDPTTSPVQRVQWLSYGTGPGQLLLQGHKILIVDEVGGLLLPHGSTKLNQSWPARLTR